MDNEWQHVEDTGWIIIPGFGRIDPRRDDVSGGRQYFTAYMDNDELAEALGADVTGGPETYYFEFDRSFLLADRTRRQCLEVEISLLVGGRYTVKYRQGAWPSSDGAW
jgi:hypothetical protein